jgi:hypothetical protein
MVAKLVDGSPEGEARVCLGEAIQQIAKPSPIMITTLGPAAGLPPGGTLCCRGSVIDLIPYTLRSGRDICVSSDVDGGISSACLHALTRLPQLNAHCAQR